MHICNIYLVYNIHLYIFIYIIYIIYFEVHIYIQGLRMDIYIYIYIYVYASKYIFMCCPISSVFTPMLVVRLCHVLYGIADRIIAPLRTAVSFWDTPVKL